MEGLTKKASIIREGTENFNVLCPFFARHANCLLKYSELSVTEVPLCPIPEKIFFNACAQIMINGQVQLLNLIRFGLGYANRNIAYFG